MSPKSSGPSHSWLRWTAPHAHSRRPPRASDADAQRPASTPHVSENVVVKALRADDVAPVTKTDLDRPELAAKSVGAGTADPP